MEIKTINFESFKDQRPGTSGLRKKVPVFMQPHYLESFIQAALDAIAETCPAGLSAETILIGGDGRYYNRQAIQTIVRVAAANHVGGLLIARSGLLSTPAASAVIRARGICGGFVLSASHNPGGPSGDFGVKYNGRNGGPAPEQLTERIFALTKVLKAYRTTDASDVNIDKPAVVDLGECRIEIIDPLEDYMALMRKLFDFPALRKMFKSGFRVRFDAMNAITGPYAKAILEDELGAEPGSVIRALPLEDFGGLHPDPNLTYAADLVAFMNSPQAADLGAASDGDGDRNLILGPACFVTPGDSVAIIAEHAASAIPGYSGGLSGVARSMPTSTALDRVASALKISCYEVPTGWKYFGNLMDAGKCTICGEESFGTGSSHIREKDGLWAVLCWLSVLQKTGLGVSDIVKRHWARFGRSYYQRHDYEGLSLEPANAMIEDLRSKLNALAGRAFAHSRIKSADDFFYKDPVDGSETSRQGIRIQLEDGSRIIIRLSGTGTEGATLRVYFERFLYENVNADVEEMLQPLVLACGELIGLKERLGRDEATVVT